MTNLSKSRYCSLWQCPKRLWLDLKKPEEAAESADSERQFAKGTMIGDLARGIFGPYTNVTTLNTDGSLDIAAMIRKTEEEINKGTSVICEAAFSCEGFYCAVDILKKEDNGWAIYEVKSSSLKEGDSSSDSKEKKEKVKPVYIADISFQKYVLEKTGINVCGTYLVCINKDYIRGDELDINELFLIKDVSEEVEEESKNIKANLDVAQKVLNSEIEYPEDIAMHCKKPYPCPYWEYCTKDIIPDMNVSVFSLYGSRFDSNLKRFGKGLKTFTDIYNNKKEYKNITNSMQRNQIECLTEGKDEIIDKDGIRAFIDKLSYPLYFLDFETMQVTVPEFKGTKPNMQIPFQYSLHIIETEGGEMVHKEFLGESGTDTRRRIAESLCENIPESVPVIVYTKFECARLKELADAFPDLAPHLLSINDNIIDLCEPFSAGYYYRKSMGGSVSIKSVLPSLCPGDPELDYHSLEGVHNGGEAMDIFPKIKDMTPEEQERTRTNLLAYCKLDTLAMVKVLEKLKEALV